MYYFKLEESQYYNIILGKQIIEKELNVKLDGFFLQESAYHPDLPYLLKKAGYKWLGFHINQIRKPIPVILKDNNEEIIGIPYFFSPVDSHFSPGELIYGKGTEGRLYAFLGDFELSPNLINFKHCLRNRKNKFIQVIEGSMQRLP